MEDILPTLIIIGVVYLLFKWLSGSKSGSNGGEGVIRGVTPAMVETVHAAFPDIPLPNIIYHLSRSRSAQTTSEVILERGFLPAPPPNFNIPAALLPTTTATTNNSSSPATSASSNSKTAPAPAKASSLIDRYNLSSRLSSTTASSPSPSPVPSIKGKEVDPIEKNGAGDANSKSGAGSKTPLDSALAQGRPSTPGTPGSTASSTGNWETTREKRELGLKERKERMILEARRRMLEKQAKEAAAA
ncbi:hypothetical protein I316_03633 [Kwoniella heveanensis BCC8398]|uniref:CUE domain-containing protein n=1 Tax=Kwoniella heveanensis BCC8398 TaxID=1296120 RepID=A0A1B9GU93_9TREE|nr:hypothetical protein I316_03633 [Kwoniella heveanensis BCC8398]